MPLSRSKTINSLLDYDIKAKDTFQLIMKPSGRIDLQFPPKITSDKKRMRWEDDHLRVGYEEFTKFMGAYAREINIEIEYVVWNEWSIDKITTQVRNMKEHLYASGTKIGASKMPFIYISGWKIVETGLLPSFRVMGIDITYSREYVGSGKNSWPLHTKISMGCKLFTDGGSTANKGKVLELDHAPYGALRTSGNLAANRGWF